MRINQIEPWLREHGAEVQPVPLSARFNAYLSTLPWAGNGIDWRDLPHRSLRLDDVSDERVVDWARQTPVALHSHSLIIDSASEPGVMCRFEDAMRDFELLSNRPDLYICGVGLVKGEVQPTFDRFIERRSFMTLNARI
ncbi:3'-5' exoribonuclease [Streptomyces sp. RPA4-5]|uniref:3'-5' exoribonuclease n=1 Tax=unclassified Streptomyces TaxID=2593676 RepID=UPI00143E3C55|nr:MULTISPECIES: 3'-5' exoribonuclease [unclassified Streptomyces]QIY57827.1 3'-5' exoribonuclease [Streptomyces sp. RPA4-5]WJY40955.1 3'-5' exoribonuclease [Streptomyces sp. P9-2B-2]